MKEIEIILGIVVYAPIGCLIGAIFSSPILGGILGAIWGIGVAIQNSNY